jgi:hypothetical protein
MIGNSDIRHPRICCSCGRLDTFYGDGKGAMIDIGTTSIYLPEVMYKAVMIAV